MKLGSGSSAHVSLIGTVVAISLALRPRPCVEFWSNAPARKLARAMAVD
jgi:hypothetical protein